MTIKEAFQATGSISSYASNKILALMTWIQLKIAFSSTYTVTTGGNAVDYLDIGDGGACQLLTVHGNYVGTDTTWLMVTDRVAGNVGILLMKLDPNQISAGNFSFDISVCGLPIAVGSYVALSTTPNEYTAVVAGARMHVVAVWRSVLKFTDV